MGPNSGQSFKLYIGEALSGKCKNVEDTPDLLKKNRLWWFSEKKIHIKTIIIATTICEP